METDVEPEPTTLPTDIPVRQTNLPAGGRMLHQRILRAFLRTGRAPRREDLRAMAGELGLDMDLALRGLADADLVHVGEDGAVVVAYPFSGRDTGFLVRLRGGPQVQAMCAVDALGIPPMSGRDAVITATDPYSDEPVRIESAGGRWTWGHEHTVVLVGRHSAGIRAADFTCPLITFHTTEEHAVKHLANQTDATGRILSQDEAVEVAVKLFGSLLTID